MAGVAVVTGAGRGFGREISKQLAGRGYTVLATDIDAVSYTHLTLPTICSV